MAQDDRICKTLAACHFCYRCKCYGLMSCSWTTGNFPLQERSRILFRFADLIEKHNDEIAKLETWDNGKPFEQAALIEVPMLARLMRYYAGEQLSS